MSQRLVAIDDVLGALAEAGPLSADALASELRLSKLDARLVLVDAHAHGLVRTNSRGEWTTTDRGLEALTTGPDESVDNAPAWHDRSSIAAYLQRLGASAGLGKWVAGLHPRYLARRGIPLAMGAIVCAGGVAVASSRLESAEGPPIVATHLKAHAHRRSTRAPAAGSAVSTSSATARTPHLRRSTLLATTPLARHRSLPLVRQSHRRLPTQCTQRHQSHARGAAATGACAGARHGVPRSGTGGSRSGQRRRHPASSGSSGSAGSSGSSSGSAGKVTIWPPATNAGI